MHYRNGLTFLLLIFPCFGLAYQWHDRFVITPERNAYEKTSTYQEVMAFIKAVQQETGIHVETLATSKEGRDVPLLVLADPVVTSPQEASGKPIIYLQGNIHGGEVEGKEALLQLVRDILLGDKKYLLEKQILLVAPIYNSDGNDKMSRDGRRSQEGSPVMAGSRASGEGYDLNRDGVKLEALETKGLMKRVLQRWDPLLFVDMHTTNGTWHGYALTYAPNYHTCGDPATTAYLMDTMLPAITQTVQSRHGLHFYLYGGYRLNQGFPPRVWRTYNHHPRYITNYMGLRNRMAILSETFAHDRFYKRMHSAYVFASEIVAYTHHHGRQLQEIAARADRETVAYVREHAGKTKRGVRFKMAPLAEPFTLRTYRYQPYLVNGETRYFRSGEIVEVAGVENYNRFEAELEATLPRGYLMPAELTEVAAKLEEHGIRVQRLDQPVKAKGEVFRVATYQTGLRRFEGHLLARVTGSFSQEEKTFPPGSYHIDMAQPLAFLIFYLLEPQSDDGLLTWNFFDNYLEGQPGAVYPVFKYFELE